ncbi:unnamed protein product [Spirodela intermedia]|uniref:Uncharacterized protein n=1 Tax=Spirodela intermedia TaxID=51605 RepID=A0A7I8LF29_SPIIN|nr:unnamed protein product [Spirodela intermedia]
MYQNFCDWKLKSLHHFNDSQR